jgi:uncharacterized coiled-coil DUF342 family protein
MLFKHGQLPEWQEFKDMLGNKYEEFTEMMKPGLEKAKDVKKEAGKIWEEKKLPDNLRELYDSMWNKIEETFKSGQINFEDLKSVFFEKADDLKEAISKFTDKNLDLDKITSGNIDDEIKRIKGLILNWKDKFCDNCEHKKSLWEGIKDAFFKWETKAANTWTGIKEKVSPTKEQPQQPTDPNAKSSDL